MGRESTIVGRNVLYYAIKERNHLIDELGELLCKEVFKKLRDHRASESKCFAGEIHLVVNENITIIIEQYYRDNIDDDIKEFLLFKISIKGITVAAVYLSRTINENGYKWTVHNSLNYYDIPDAAENEIKKWLEDKIHERNLILQRKKEEELKEHNKIQEYINSLYENKGEK